ncbi:hypothetical protein DESC_350058 [Desulfosarcina cetonica]|nr:hypothetical protein DESC_350058 [Desulfosarcina cetonica]
MALPVGQRGQVGRAQRRHHGCREHTGGQKVHRIGVTGLLIAFRQALIKARPPESGGIDPAFLDGGEQQLRRVQAIEGEQAGNAALARHGRNQSTHPVEAVNQVGLNLGDDPVDHFALKRKGDAHTLTTGVHEQFRVVVKGAVLGQVDTVFGQVPLSLGDIQPGQGVGAVFENVAIVGHGQVDIDTPFVKGMDLGGADIPQAAGPGADGTGARPHTRWNEGHLRGHDQNPRG